MPKLDPLSDNGNKVVDLGRKESKMLVSTKLQVHIGLVKVRLRIEDGGYTLERGKGCARSCFLAGMLQPIRLPLTWSSFLLALCAFGCEDDEIDPSAPTPLCQSSGREAVYGIQLSVSSSVTLGLFSVGSNKFGRCENQMQEYGWGRGRVKKVHQTVA